MICPRCNYKLPEGSTSCDRCGLVFEYQQIHPQNSQQPQIVDGNKFHCPKCGQLMPITAKKCFKCGTRFNNPAPVIQTPKPQNAPMPQKTTSNGTPTIIPCPACGGQMSSLADKCPHCGNPRKREVANPILLDAISLIGIVISIFLYTGPFFVFSFLIMLAILITYNAYYSSIKNNPNKDASKVKQSLTIVTVLFVIMFCIGIVIML